MKIHEPEDAQFQHKGNYYKIGRFGLLYMHHPEFGWCKSELLTPRKIDGAQFEYKLIQFAGDVSAMKRGERWVMVTSRTRGLFRSVVQQAITERKGA